MRLVEGKQESRRPLVGFEASESAVALVGMEGFRLLAAVEVGGELHQLVETTAGVVGAQAAARGRCPRAGGRCGCGTCPPADVGSWSYGASGSGGVRIPTAT